MSKRDTTEQSILVAATKVFKTKGYDGATLQDIADEANTTKSMMNYYFRSKDRLFAAVFKIQFQQFMEGLAAFIRSDMSIYDKIVRLVEFDTERLNSFPMLPVFIINEINRNPELVQTIMSDVPSHAFESLKKQIRAEVKKKNIKKIRAEDLLLNIQSLTVFPVLTKPLQMKVFNKSEKEIEAMLKARKKMIVELIWNSIKAT
jgi:TetR/AcrR family transcriptional regulator